MEAEGLATDPRRAGNQQGQRVLTSGNDPSQAGDMMTVPDDWPVSRLCGDFTHQVARRLTTTGRRVRIGSFRSKPAPLVN